MSFVRPELLWLALLALPELAISALRLPRFKASLEALAGPRLRRRAGTAYARLCVTSAVAAALFLVASALALAGANWGTRGVATERRGLEAAMVLDVSRSMEVRDVGGIGPGAETRLDAAKALIGSLVRGPTRAGDGAAFSLVAAKGASVLLVPMTEDRFAFEQALAYANPDAITSPGTNLESGIAAGLESFSKTGAQGRILFLFTDGGELAGSARSAAASLAAAKARLVIVGMGSPRPSEVPGPDGAPLVGGKGPIESGLEAHSLEELAGLSGGRYIAASEASTEGALASELGAATGRGIRIEYERVDRSGLFALLALALLVVAIAASILSNSRRKG